MRYLYLIVVFLTILLPCTGQETVGELLRSNGIPQTQFSKIELAEKINGTAASKDGVTYAVYLKVKEGLLVGGPQLVKYDQKSGSVLRSSIKVRDKDICCGSPEEIEFVDDHPILSFHDNPSASTFLVVNQNLQLVVVMYGIDLTRIAPHQVVMTEGMVHFASIHAERLQFVDLSSGVVQELYPPMNDALRVAFNKKNKELMPPNDVCQLAEDDCDPSLYDESVNIVGTDGNGRFALVAGWSSSHVTKKGEDPATIASKSVLYLYEKSKNGWLFCGCELSDTEASSLFPGGKGGYDDVKTRCKPDKKVVPDMGTSDLSPFPKPSRQME